MKYLLALAGIALLGCADQPTAPQHFGAPQSARLNNVINVHDSSAVTLVSCSGEPIVGSYISHTIENVTFPPSGNGIVHLTADYRISGIGELTGASYQGFLSIKDMQESGQANVAKFKYTLLLVSQGSIPNTYVDVTSMVVMNANGDVVVTDAATGTRCH